MSSPRKGCGWTRRGGRGARGGADRPRGYGVRRRPPRRQFHSEKHFAARRERVATRERSRRELEQRVQELREELQAAERRLRDADGELARARATARYRRAR